MEFHVKVAFVNLAVVAGCYEPSNRLSRACWPVGVHHGNGIRQTSHCNTRWCPNCCIGSAPGLFLDKSPNYRSSIYGKTCCPIKAEDRRAFVWSDQPYSSYPRPERWRCISPRIWRRDCRFQQRVDFLLVRNCVEIWTPERKITMLFWKFTDATIWRVSSTAFVVTPFRTQHE